MINISQVFRLGKEAVFQSINEKGGFIKLWLVASSKQKQGEQWVDVATWCSASLWRQNDKMVQYLQKGTQVFISGKIYEKEYEGKKYLTLDIREIDLVGGRQDQQQQPPPAPRQNVAPPTAPVSSTDGSDTENDLPF